MNLRRHERVRELLKRELSVLLLREFPPADHGLLSVHEVMISGDLQLATVHVSVVGNADQQKRTLAALQAERKRIQGLVGQAVVLKYTPELKFVTDDSIARGDRVLRIMEQLEKDTPPQA